MTQLMALSVLIFALFMGLRWPGFHLAGCFFSYQVSIASGFDNAGIAYVLCVTAISVVRFYLSPHRFYPHLMDLAIVLLLFWAALSALWSPIPAESIRKYVLLLLSVGGMYGVGRWSVTKPDRLARQFLAGILTCGAVMSIIMIMSVDPRQIRDVGRVAIGEGTAVGLSQPLPYILVAAFVTLFVGRSKWLYGLALLAIGTTFYLALASGTRSVFLAAGAVILFITISHFREMRFGLMVRVGLIAISAILCAPFLLAGGEFDRTITRLTRNFSGGGVNLGDDSAVARLYAYSDAIQMFRDAPIWGHGYGSFSVMSFKAYPHNIFLEISSELGMIGLCLLLLWLISYAYALWVIRRHNRFAGIVMIAIAATSFVQMQVSFAFYMARPLFLISAVAAAMLVQEGHERRGLMAKKKSRRALYSRPHFPHARPTQTSF